MDEELLKRYTDCVYFLASPLTCKKGIECEYRHNEIARLNPKDCWFWLAGSCLNPTCAFRHPPLDGRSEPLAESASLPCQFSEPVSKTHISCYYFFNGFCNKGDRCSFLHGPDGSSGSGSSAWNSLKTASTVTDAPPLENKTFVGSNSGSAPTEAHPRPTSSQTATKTVVELQYQHKDHQYSAPNSAQEESASPQRSASQCEEATAVKSEFFIPAEGFIQDTSPCTDQSSEDQVDGHIEPEERWESSPGFDVLVDDKSEDLDYEEDPEYVLALDRTHRDLNSHHLLPYDYEFEYDSGYLDTGFSYESGICDSYDHLENEHSPDHIGILPKRTREVMLNPILSRKRKFVPREPSANGRSGMDLRNRLRNRRLIDGHSVNHPAVMLNPILSRKRKFVPREPSANGRSGMDLRKCLRKHRLIDGHSVNHPERRYISSHPIGRNRERPRQYCARELHGRLRSEVENNINKSFGEIEDRPRRGKQQGLFRPSRINGSRQHYKEKRMDKQRFLSSEISQESVLRKGRSTQESVSRKGRSTLECSSFSGPKTLLQIKEEKRKTRETGDCFGKMGHTSRNSSEDFQGPKPLIEILKDKGRLAA